MPICNPIFKIIILTVILPRILSFLSFFCTILVTVEKARCLQKNHETEMQNILGKLKISCLQSDEEILTTQETTEPEEMEFMEPDKVKSSLIFAANE